MKKLAVAVFALFAFTTELQLKKNECKKKGAKCTFNSSCCSNLVCLSQSGNKCGPHVKPGYRCGEDGECGSTAFCDKAKSTSTHKICIKKYDNNYKCKKDKQCKSGHCNGNLGGLRSGTCRATVSS